MSCISGVSYSIASASSVSGYLGLKTCSFERQYQELRIHWIIVNNQNGHDNVSFQAR
jgi:hypothetical protein